MSQIYVVYTDDPSNHEQALLAALRDLGAPLHPQDKG
jgi:hypothetical protein